jgi:hypothetical protein
LAVGLFSFSVADKESPPNDVDLFVGQPELPRSGPPRVVDFIGDAVTLRDARRDGLSLF